MDPVGDREVIQHVKQAATLRPQAGCHLGQQQRRADPVLVAHLVRVDAVPDGLLVAVAQPGHPGDPLEPGQRLLVPDPGVRRHGRQQPGGHDRVGEDGVGVDTASEDMGSEQGADLVAAQHPPPGGVVDGDCCRVGDGNRAPVGVRVVGQDDIGMDHGGQGEGGVDRTGLLGVGEAHRRELRVRLRLAGHHDGGAEPGPGEGGDHDVVADPVQRCVDDGQLARAVRGDDRSRRVEIRLEHVLVQRGPAALRPGHVGDPVDEGDPRGDPRVRRWHDLAAVTEVHLVAVVQGGVVACRHHDPGIGPQVADREGQHRSWQGAGQQHRAAPGGDDHGRRVTGKDVGLVSGIKADDHQRLR